MRGPCRSAWEDAAFRHSPHHSDLYFGLAEPRGFGGDSNRAGHRQFTATTERKTIHSSDDRLAEVFNEVRKRLAGPRFLFRRERSIVAISLMSAPAANDLSPAPVKTTPRTSASSRASSERGSQFENGFAFRALSTLGRLMVT